MTTEIATTTQVSQPPANLTVISHDDNQQAADILNEILLFVQAFQVLEPLVVNVIHPQGNKQIVVQPSQQS